MRRTALLLISAFCAVSFVSAQQTLTQQEMLGITPMLSKEVQLPADARASLTNKLRQMALRNGFGSTSGRFVLTADVVTLDKQITRTAPAQYIVELEVSVYLVDVLQQVLIDEMPFVVKGIDRSERAAFIKAVNTINSRSPESRRFMALCREKILDYYSTNMPAIIKKAEAMAGMQQFDRALAMLSDIPETIDGYPMVADRLVDIYKQKIDAEAQATVRSAEALLAAGKLEEAMETAASVNPLSNHASSADAVIRSARGKGNADVAALADEYSDIYRKARTSADASDTVETARAYGISVADHGALEAGLNEWSAGYSGK